MGAPGEKRRGGRWRVRWARGIREGRDAGGCLGDRMGVLGAEATQEWNIGVSGAFWGWGGHEYRNGQGHRVLWL